MQSLGGEPHPQLLTRVLEGILVSQVLCGMVCIFHHVDTHRRTCAARSAKHCNATIILDPDCRGRRVRLGDSLRGSVAASGADGANSC